MSDPVRIAFAYRHALLGGVSTQLLNRESTLSSRYSTHYLFESDHGLAQAFPVGRTHVTATPAEKVDALRKIDPDLLIVIDTPSFLDAWKEADLRGDLMIEVHTTYHRNTAYLQRLADDLDIAVFSTVSEYMAEKLEDLGLRERAPVTLIPNCLDSRWFSAPEPVPLDGQPLVWVGKLDDHKRWRAGLDLIDRVLTKATGPVDPLLIGGYTSTDSEVLKAFAGKLRSTPALARAEWWPYVQYERMPLIYRSVAVAGGGKVSTTRDESFGMSIAESIVMGCPTVAPRVGALPELLPDAAMYEPNDWTEAERIGCCMLSDASYRNEMLGTVESVKERLHPERMLSAFDETMRAAGVVAT